MLASSAHYQSIWRYMFFAPYGGDLVLWLGKDKALQYRAGKIVRDKIIFDAALGQATLKKLDAIRRVFIAYAGQRGIDPRGVLPYWIFAVDTLRHAARKLAALGIGGTDTAVVRRKLATEMIQLRQRFKRLWLAHSYISEIGQTLKLYRQAIRSLKRPAMVCAPPVNRLMVSRAMPSAGKLEGLKYPSDIKALRFRLHDFWGSYCNFRDLFAATPGKNAMVWISRELICKEPMRFVVILGHEGPAKLWMDGKLRYYKPVGVGISIIRMPFVTEGRHVLLLALNLVNGNGGSLWLQFGRRDRPRGSATLLPQAQV
jgi:hypothetical protein